MILIFHATPVYSAWLSRELLRRMLPWMYKFCWKRRHDRGTAKFRLEKKTSKTDFRLHRIKPKKKSGLTWNNKQNKYWFLSHIPHLNLLWNWQHSKLLQWLCGSLFATTPEGDKCYQFSSDRSKAVRKVPICFLFLQSEGFYWNLSGAWTLLDTLTVTIVNWMSA